MVQKKTTREEKKPRMTVISYWGDENFIVAGPSIPLLKVAALALQSCLLARKKGRPSFSFPHKTLAFRTARRRCNLKKNRRVKLLQTKAVSSQKKVQSQNWSPLVAAIAVYYFVGLIKSPLCALYMCACPSLLSSAVPLPNVVTKPPPRLFEQPPLSLLVSCYGLCTWKGWEYKKKGLEERVGSAQLIFNHLPPYT